MSDTSPPARRSFLIALGPGILVAATGVGAGDLATGGFTGVQLGVAVLWAVLIGAGLKYVLNEGLARWQLATGRTLLEGAMRHFPLPVQLVFLVYLVYWTFFVAVALMSACGATAVAILPAFGTSPDDMRTGKIAFGIVHSIVGVLLVELGGFKLFQRVMSVCIAVMFVTVVITAAMVTPDWLAVLKGLVWPSIPRWREGGLAWTVALMGGVGGTVTVLCYGYWIREDGRTSPDDLRACRLDLAIGYGMTAIFGIAMVIIGSRVPVEDSKGAVLIASLAQKLGDSVGQAGRWTFLIGAWGAVFSSLLGVWQSVPYLFAEFWGQFSGREVTPGEAINTKGLAYRGFLYAMAAVPMLGLWFSFQEMQKVYAVIGAAFMPMLAIALLWLNGTSRIGTQHRNKPLTTVALIGTLIFFLAMVGMTVYEKFH